MRKSVWKITAAVVGVLAAAIVACRPNQTVERQADDASIKTSIKAKLASDVRFSTLTAVSVDVTNGLVTLAGPVHSDEEKQKIEETVRAVKGVTGVTNNLQVQPEAGPPPSGATPAATTPPAAGSGPAAMTPPWSTTPGAAATPAVTP
jgi:BON domain-containing protein